MRPGSAVSVATVEPDKVVCHVATAPSKALAVTVQLDVPEACLLGCWDNRQ
jgi:hypothetical protein